MKTAPFTARYHIFIIDDSTLLANSEIIRRFVEAFHSPVVDITIVGQEEQSKLSAIFRQSSAWNAYTQYIHRKLGTGVWDLAGVRNLAFILAFTLSACDDVVFFLDDDIILTPTVYRGHSLIVHGNQVMGDLREALTNPRALVAGTRFVGRADTSILDHIYLTFEAMDTESIVIRNAAMESAANAIFHQYPPVLPISIQLDSYVSEEGPGISGGAMAAKPEAIFSHCLPQTYNEDWIWLSLLGANESAIARVTSHVAHVPGDAGCFDPAFMTFQSKGEISYRAVRATLQNIKDGVSRFEHVAVNLSVRHIREAKAAVLEEAREALVAVAKGKERLFMLHPERIANTIAGSDWIESALVTVLQSLHETPIECILDSLTGYLSLRDDWRRFLTEMKTLNALINTALNIKI